VVVNLNRRYGETEVRDADDRQNKTSEVITFASGLMKQTSQARSFVQPRIGADDGGQCVSRPGKGPVSLAGLFFVLVPLFPFGCT